MKKNQIIYLENGAKALTFKSLLNKNLITTNELGDFSSNMLSKNGNHINKTVKNHFSADGFIFLEPEHKDFVFWVSNKESQNKIKGDGIIYFGRKENSGNEKIISAPTGDCPYLIIEAESNGVKFIGLVHSGWRGTRLNIIAQALKPILKVTNEGSQLNIGILSGICQNCYEVNDDVYAEFPPEYSEFFIKQPDNKWKLNLLGIIEKQIFSTVGISRLINIEIIRACPFCYRDENDKPLLFSYRRGEMQRNMICAKI